MEKISENEKARGKTKRVKEIFMDWSQRVDINVYTKMLDYRPNYKVQFIWVCQKILPIKKYAQLLNAIGLNF